MRINFLMDNVAVSLDGIVTNVGLASYTSSFFQSTTSNTLSTFAMGIGTTGGPTVPSATDTCLNDPVALTQSYIDNIGTAAVTQISGSSYITGYEFFIGLDMFNRQGGLVPYCEAGLFLKIADKNILFCRNTFPIIKKSKQNKITIVYQLIFANNNGRWI